MTNAQTALLAATRIYANSRHRHDTKLVLAQADKYLEWLDLNTDPDEEEHHLDFSSTTERADPPDPDNRELHTDPPREPLYRRAGF